MKGDVKHHVRTCVKCQNTKLVHKKKFELYKPLPIHLRPFDNVSMDFMTCLLKRERMDAIFVMVNRFSKLVKFTSTQTNAMTIKMAKLFFDMWVQHNGC
jgi:hypothetical protein